MASRRLVASKRSSSKLVRRAAFVSAAVAGMWASGAAAAGAAAATRTWDNGGADLTWANEVNWDGSSPGNGIPGTADTAAFTATGLGTVDLGGVTRTVSALTLGGASAGYTFSNGTLSLNSMTLTATNAGTTAFSTALQDQGGNRLLITDNNATDTLNFTGLVTITSALNTNSSATALAIVGNNNQHTIGIGSTSGTNSVAGGVWVATGTGGGTAGVSFNGAWTIGGNFESSSASTLGVHFTSSSVVSITGNLKNSSANNMTFDSGSSVSVGGDLLTTTTGKLTINQALAALTGSVKVYGGTLSVNVNNIIPSTSAPFLLGDTAANANAAVISIDTAGKTVANPITVQSGAAGTATIQGGVNGTTTYSNTITLNKAVTLNSNTATNVLDITGKITGNQNVAITGNAITSVVGLTSTNDFGGSSNSVTLTSGLARVAADSAFGNSTNSIVFNGGGIQFNGTSYDITTTGRALTYTAAKTVTIDTNGVSSTTFSGAIGGGTTALFTKVGSGTLVFGSANTYGGLTTISGGTLQSAIASSGFGTNASIAMGSGAQLNLRSNGSISFTNGTAAYNIAAPGVASGTSTIDVNNNGSGSGNTLTLGTWTQSAAQSTSLNVTGGNGYILALGSVALTYNSAKDTKFIPTTANLQIGSANSTSTTAGATITLDGTSSANTIGAITATTPANLGLVKSSSSTWTLSGANTYAGGTTLSAGQLNINNASALGTGTFTPNGGTFDNITGGTLTFANLIGGMSGNFGFGGTKDLVFSNTAQISIGATKTITLGGTNSTLTFAAPIRNTTHGQQTFTVNGATNTLVVGGWHLDDGGTGSSPQTFNGTGNLTITGPVAERPGAGDGITYSGTGVMTFAATTTGSTPVTGSPWSGGTTIGSATVNGGTVQVGNGGTTGDLGTSAGAINNWGTLVFNRSDDFTWTRAIGGTGAGGNLIQKGPGTLFLNATDTFNGQTSITGGKLSLMSSLALQNSTVLVPATAGGNAGAALQFDTSVGTHSFSVGGLGGSNNLLLADNTSGTAVAITLTVGGASTSSTGYTGIISGTGGAITKTGTGVFGLNSNHTYDGATTVNNGVLRLLASGSDATKNLPSVNSNVSLTSTGTVEITGNTALTLGTAANQIQLTGSTVGFGAYGGDYTLNLGAVTWASGGFAPSTAFQLGTTTSSGKVTLSSDVGLNAATRTISVVHGTQAPGAADAEISGRISGTTGAGPLAFTGGGTIVLSGANTYTANTGVTPTVVTSGTTLVVSTLGNAGSASSPIGGTSANTRDGEIGLGSTGVTGTLRYIGSGETTNRVISFGATSAGANSSGGTPIIDASGTGALVITSNIAGRLSGTGAGGNLWLTGSSTGNILNTFAGRMTQGVSLITSSYNGIRKSGSGTWVLSNAADTYWGGTTISDGALVAGADAQGYITGTGDFATTGRTLTVSNIADFPGIAVGDYIFSDAGLATGTTSGIHVNTISNITGNVITFSASGVVNNAPGASFDFAKVTGGALGIPHDSGGRVQLGDASTTASSNPALMIGGAFTVAAPVYVNNYAANSYTLGGNTANVSTFSGLVTASQPMTFSQVASGTLNVTGGVTAGGGTQRVTFSGAGNISVGTNAIADGSGQIAVTVAGPGTTTFSVPSTYTGGTILSAGTLRVTNATGSATGSGSVTLNGGTLASGTVGVIGGTVTAGSGAHTIAPGGDGTIGSLSVGSLTANANTTLKLDFGTGAASDLVTLSSAGLTLSGISALPITFGTAPTVAGYYRIFTGNIAGLAGELSLPANSGGFTYSLDTAHDSGYVDLNVALVTGFGSGIWSNAHSNGNWSDSGNWDLQPNGAGHVATFAATGAGTVNLDQARIIGGIVFNSATAYTIGANGGNTLTLDSGSASPATITLTAGSHTIASPVALNSDLNVSGGGAVALTGGLSNGSLAGGFTITKNDAGTLTISGAQSHATGAALNVNAGTVNLNSDAGGLPGFYEPNLAITSANSAVVNLGSTQHVAGVAVNGTSRLNVGNGTGTNYAKVLVTPTLSVAGTLDVTNNAVVVQDHTAGADTTIRGLVTSGKIISSSADTNHAVSVLTAQQAHDNGNTGVLSTITPGYHGEFVTGNDVLVQYGWNGDLNMDSQVDYLDYGVIDNGYLAGATTYAQGDLNGDHVINYLDYGIIDNAYLAQTAPHTAAMAAASAAALSSSAVPEPAALGLLGIGVLGLLARRRRAR